MYWNSFLSALAPLLVFALAGAVARAVGLVRDREKRLLDQVIIYVALPALIFSVVYSSSFSVGLVAVPVIGWLTLIVSAGTARVLAGLTVPRELTGAFVLTAAIGNTGYFGYPLALALFGQTGLVAALFYDLLASVPFLFSIGIAAARYYGGKGGKLNPVGEVLTFPPFLALLAAYGLQGASRAGWFAVPAPVLDLTNLLGQVAVPLIVVSIGAALRIASISRFWRPMLMVAGVKLVLAPLVAFGLGQLLLEGPTLGVTVLEASMPTFMLSMVIGSRYDLNQEFIGAAVLSTTLVSVGTVPLMQLVLGLA